MVKHFQQVAHDLLVANESPCVVNIIKYMKGKGQLDIQLSLCHFHLLGFYISFRSISGSTLRQILQRSEENPNIWKPFYVQKQVTYLK